MNRTETPIKDKETIRNNGMFYTPKIWVDYAHKMIEDTLGKDWKEEYIVWDNCAGTKSLTMDYTFKELYSSTLKEEELEASKEYNPEATSFQFDFLNDPEDKLPAGLLEAFKQNKKIVFFLNPPYGTPSSTKKCGGGVCAGSSNTKVKEQMQCENIEGSEFIKQFLWRITDIHRKWNLTNCYIACFTKPTWLTGPKSITLRKLFLNNFLYMDGIMFQASEFADVSGGWGITFNVWKSGIEENKNEFVHKLCKLNDSGDIDVFNTKTLHNFDGLNIKTSPEYITENLGKKKNKELIVCKNPTKFDYRRCNENIYDNYIGVIMCHGNSVQENLFSSITNKRPISGGGNLQCTKDNFEQCMVVQSIRRETINNWITAGDRYNMNNEPTEEFINDSIVRSLFCASNYCCGICLDDGARLKNEFFWMSKEEMADLANDWGLDDVYNDAKTSNERFVYEKLKTITLSKEAQAVLDKACELVKESFVYREIFSEEHPEYQLDKCWDAGYYQLKAIWKEFLPDDFRKFKELYKALADKMRPMVYELGFLKK